MNELNVFNNPYCFWRAPFQWFKRFFRNIKFAYQRVTKGYCDYDCYDLDSYYTAIITNTLRELAAHHYSHPFGMEPEEWTEKLNDIASKIENSSEKYEEIHVPSRAEWYEHYCKKPEQEGEALENWNCENDKLREKMNKEEQEYFTYRTMCKNEALDLLKEYWYDLWD